MVDFTPRLPRRGTVVRTVAISVIALGVLVTITAIYVYFQAVRTFEVRRVSLPTRIFTDLYPLAVEREIDRDDVIERLHRLGYREEETLEKPGDFNAGEEDLQIYLRGFRYPGGDQEARKVRLRFSKAAIDAVEQIDGGGQAFEAALEPELLTSILSDQLENRRPVTLDQIPQHLIDAVVVTEDVRFWQHPGVDPIGIVRALFRNVKAGGVAQGGSTLTQQLVKNYYLTNERTFRRKLVEAFMSVILDAKYSKKEILEAYLNDIYLGRNRSISILGVGEAAQYYFGKPVSELAPSESALLAGIIRSPNNYSPFENPERVLSRRNRVLDLMLKHEKLSREQYAEAVKTPLPKKPYREKSGLGSIPFYVDRVLDEMRQDYGIEDVKGRGLSIYTAIDLDWQDEAAKQLEQGLHSLERSSRRLRRARDPLEGALIAVDVDSGEIRALVGGRDYQRSQFNRAVDAKRQVGSLFKPIVITAAFEPSLSNQNITPATRVNDDRFVLERRFAKDWSPKNYEGRYHGIVTVREALVQSMNVASVRIGLSTGLDAIIKAAHALGIESELDPVPSLILGSVTLAPIEMAEAYTTLAREGSRIPLHAVKFATNDDGKAIGSGERVSEVQAFPARDVYLTLHLMEGVLTSGTAARARYTYGFRKTAAGKTGTTNDKRDAWFIGFTPKTLALTWVGFDDNSPVGFSGSEGAVPIWARFMKSVTANDKDADFPVPAGIVFTEIDQTSGGLATPYCPKDAVILEAFKAGTAPALPCQDHRPPPPPPLEQYGLFPGQLAPSTTETSGMPPLEGGTFGTQPVAPPVPPTTQTQPPTSTQPSPTLTLPPPRDEPPPRAEAPAAERPREAQPPPAQSPGSTPPREERTEDPPPPR